MNFKEYLNKEINRGSYNNKEIVIALNMLDECFKNLDEITFSRWRNGRAVPSLKKQILLNRKFGHDFSFFLKNIDLPKISKVFDAKIKRVFKKDNSYNAIDYFSSNCSEKLILKTQPNNEELKTILSFYNLFPSYHIDSELFKCLTQQNTDVLYVKSPLKNIPSSHTAITFMSKPSCIDGFFLKKIRIYCMQVTLELYQNLNC